MLSHLHETLLQPFRDGPVLAAKLLYGALQGSAPEFTAVRIESADLPHSRLNTLGPERQKLSSSQLELAPP